MTSLSSPQKQDLKQHYQDVEVKALGTWPHRGNIELYFKHRYGGFNHPIGSLTEYFQFPQVKPVLTDLQRIQSV
ncbi:MAG: hypothetical protein SAJ12_14160 [Jaaginema sp. PMC 1079.18]|nr:hypothetical protein [Jaaginema sp. PMC 1079.18]MEC4867651.1 hypothetical protein [Jaaginema sp. PMC 1078.18]